jgi:mannose-6-phosphate isomerase-like protein (cupin superfamily)
MGIRSYLVGKLTRKPLLTSVSYDTPAEKAVSRLKELNDLIDDKQVEIFRGTGVMSYNGWKIRSLFQAEDESITVADCELTSKKAFPLHVHKDSIEFIVVKEGEITVRFDDGKKVKASAGSPRNFVYIEKNQSHVVASTSKGVTKILFVIIPANSALPYPLNGLGKIYQKCGGIAEGLHGEG